MEKLYIYGKLNKEEIIKQYTAGLGNGTANTIIDNQNNKISVEVIKTPHKLSIKDVEFDGSQDVIVDLSEYATIEQLSQLNNRVDTFDSKIDSINTIANTELFAYVDTDSTTAGKIVLRFKNKNNATLGTSVIEFPDQIQADWMQADSTKPSYIRNKPTRLSQFTNDGDGKGSPFITVADVDAKVDEKLKIIKTDGQGNKYLADDGKYKDIVTNRSLNPVWKIDGTTQEFINSILADSTAVVGTSYLGGVEFTDLPTPLNNAECLVEILSSTLGSDIKVIHLDLYSATTSPYHWSTIYYTQLPDPIWQPDVTQSDVDTKLDKTGGTISGDLNIAGNLEVAGTTITKDAETLLIKDNVIVTNSDKQTLLTLSGLAINKNSNETYGIMYDPTSDSVKLGLGSFDENNKFTFSESGNPVAVRSDSSLLIDGHLIKWDSNSYCFVDSGKSIDDFVLKGEIKQDYQIVTTEPEDKSQGKMIYEKSSGSNAPFQINELKIADGTKYNSLRDLVNEGMQEKLTAGTGITIENNIISATAQDIRTDNQTTTLNANQEIQTIGVYNTSTNNTLSANDLWLASSIKRRKK